MNTRPSDRERKAGGGSFLTELVFTPFELPLKKCAVFLR